MRPLLFFLLIFNSLLFNSQCVITGPDTIQVGEKQEYSATSSKACDRCHQWSHLDQKIILESDVRENPLIIKGAVEGVATLSLSISKAAQKEKCSKMIQVISPLSNVLDLNNPKCDIKGTMIRESRVGDKEVKLETDLADSDYSYRWTAVYRDGTAKTVIDETAVFNFSTDIDKISLEITAGPCKKTITKSYNTYFWWFF